MQPNLPFLLTLCVYSATAHKDNYIVKFKDGVDTSSLLQYVEQNSVAANGEQGCKVKYKYSPKTLNGFAGYFKESFLDHFKHKFSNFIEYIEEDGEVTTYEDNFYKLWAKRHTANKFSPNPLIKYNFENEFVKKVKLAFGERFEIIDIQQQVKSFGEQPDAPWGLKRISTRALVSPLPSYKYDDRAGANVTVYLLDTGSTVNHPEIKDHIVGSYNVMTKTTNVTDGVGHGTHCSGTICSVSYGVAKKVSLFPIKVLSDSGSGSLSDVIAGIDYVIKLNRPGNKVISMSLGGQKSKSVNDAVDTAHKAGIVLVSAAGNNNGDACQYSPGSATESLTVGATDSADKRASFSNFGVCVDIFAPGVKILSTLPSGKPSEWDGTSMACPHVSGAVALLWSIYPNLTSTEAKAKVLSMATTLGVGNFLYNQF